MRPPWFSRRESVIRLSSTTLPLLLLGFNDGSLSDLVRRAVVRGAQTADKVDPAWQQLSGEVVPAWQDEVPLRALPPPAAVDAAFAAELLALPLEVAAARMRLPGGELAARLPAARAQSVLLYDDSTAAVGPGARGKEAAPRCEWPNAAPAGC